MALPINIYDTVFQILGVTSRVTGNFQTDFLNLIFFPHIIIIIWLFLIARGPLFMALHRGFGTLLSIAVYIFIIWYGWYSAIASLSVIWLGLTIIISFFYFMVPKFLHPSTSEAQFGLARAVTGKLVKRREIDKAITRLNQDVRDCDQELQNLQRREGHETAPELRRALRDEINAVTMRKMGLNAEVRRLENEKKL